jgi:hypothetical protein
VFQALWSAGSLGVVAGLFALGALWERHRHSPPPTIYRIILSVEAPERPLRGPQSDETPSGGMETAGNDQGERGGPGKR